MSKPASPFAGIKLSDQTKLSDRGDDQRLFNSSVQTQQSPKVPTKEARKEGSKEPWNQGKTAEILADDKPLFDINEPAYQNNTYVFTEQELWAIEDTTKELRRMHRLKITRYNLVRLGVHFLLEDYQKNKEASFLVRRIGHSKNHE